MPRPGKPKPRTSVAPRGPIVRPEILADRDGPMRLQKFLANAGVDSRRNCEEFIRTGRVTVDGEIVKDPATSVESQQQDIRLDGEQLRLPRYRYYVLNKPKGVVCSNRDPAGRPRAVDLVPTPDGQRLFTVGRLDANTEGLLIVTNDGAIAEQLAHPRYQVPRQYRVQVAGVPNLDTLTELRKGMHFSDGFFHFQSIRLMKRKGRSSFLELELREGKNREIRRMFARAGHKVMHLERIAFGPIRIGRLALGEYRELRTGELRNLYQFISNPVSVRNARPGKPKRPKKKSANAKRTSSDHSKSRRGAARHGSTDRPARKPRRK